MDFQEIVQETKYEGSASSYISEILRRAIFSGSLIGGARLRQEEIARQLGVSSIPVREALRQLQAEGLVEIIPRRGAVVTELEVSEIREIYEMRTFLETGALKLAFDDISGDVIEKARHCLDEMEITEDDIKWCQLNEEFHDLLYRISGREMLLEFLKNLRSRVNRYVITYLRAMRNESEQEHRKILKAIDDRDKNLALRELEDHLKNAVDAIVAGKKRETE
ncbi:MAG: GntR family transcriptional regulator [Thermovirgaceae bacterium]